MHLLFNGNELTPLGWVGLGVIVFLLVMAVGIFGGARLEESAEKSRVRLTEKLTSLVGRAEDGDDGAWEEATTLWSKIPDKRVLDDALKARFRSVEHQVKARKNTAEMNKKTAELKPRFANELDYLGKDDLSPSDRVEALNELQHLLDDHVYPEVLEAVTKGTEFAGDYRAVIKAKVQAIYDELVQRAQEDPAAFYILNTLYERWFKDYDFVLPGNWAEMVVRYFDVPTWSDFRNCASYGSGEVTMLAQRAIDSRDIVQCAIALAACNRSKDKRREVGDVTYDRLADIYAELRAAQPVVTVPASA